MAIIAKYDRYTALKHFGRPIRIMLSTTFPLTSPFYWQEVMRGFFVTP